MGAPCLNEAPQTHTDTHPAPAKAGRQRRADLGAAAPVIKRKTPHVHHVCLILFFTQPAVTFILAEWLPAAEALCCFILTELKQKNKKNCLIYS